MIFRGKRLGLTMWGTEPVAAMVRHAVLAERIGFDSVWLIDSQLLCRDVTVSLTAILSATNTLRAATGVTQPVTRHVSVISDLIPAADDVERTVRHWFGELALNVGDFLPVQFAPFRRRPVWAKRRL